MAEHENVYKNESERYHALVSFEDYQQNLTQTLREYIPSEKTILESGAGTGRVTKLLFPIARNLVSFDLSQPMLFHAKRVSDSTHSGFRGYASADHRLLPIENSQFDWIVSGWSVCYLVSWEGPSWKQEVGKALREFNRVLKPDGSILIIETLGTGKTSPEPPAHLSEYLSYLDEIGFQRHWMRTDYQFPNSATARDLTQFFFGSEMLEYISPDPQPILPECTGIWVCQRSDFRKNLPG
jgi:ubiquinone/menaquinone biosynthesis C-methylase UbiE